LWVKTPRVAVISHAVTILGSELTRRSDPANVLVTSGGEFDLEEPLPARDAVRGSCALKEMRVIAEL